MTIAYTTGQITLTNGSAVVTGIGTAWAVSLIAGGMIAAEAGGNLLPIESVDSDTSITAAIEWRGATGTYDYALVRDTAYLQQLNLNSNTLARLIAELNAGTIFKYDASGDLVGRATYDGRPKGFSYLVFIGVDEPELYVKASAGEGDWDGPFSYGTGPEGPVGPAGYVNFRGVYAGATAYAKNDGVLYNGSSFVALQATTGNAPPTLPTTSNAHWQLLAIKGTDGTGTGDVVGPNSATNNYLAVFDGVTGKLLKQMAASAANISFSNGVANLPGNPATVQAAIEAIGNSGGKNDALLALEIADLKGQRMGMVGGVADPFDDTSGVNLGGIDSNTVIALHLDVATGFADSAPTPHSFTASGGAAISSAQSVFGGGSASFAASGDKVQTPNSSDLSFGSGDFTIDFRVRLNAGATFRVVYDFGYTSANALLVQFDTTAKLYVYSGGTPVLNDSLSLLADVWYHYAIVRSANILYMFRDGVQVASFTLTSQVFSNTAALSIGGKQTDSSLGLNGYLDELRVSKVARWTGGFTPPPVAYSVGEPSNANYSAANDWFTPTVPASGVPNNMQLVSVSYAASATPSNARVAVQLADALTLVPNTDFSMEVSRDGGTSWTAVTLALTVPSFGGVKMYDGTVSLNGQPSGSSMRWRFKTLTNKNIIASGVVLQQS